MLHEERSTHRLLAELVRFDSSNVAGICAMFRVVTEILTEAGAECRTVDNKDNPAFVLATFGSNRPGGILFCGHADVAPVDDTNWRTDPFSLHEVEDAVVGRGAANMKGFLATAMTVAQRRATENAKFPIHVAVTTDALRDFQGARMLATYLRDNGVAPSLMLLGEPSDMRVVGKTKGLGRFTTNVRCPGGYATVAGYGPNAINVSAHLVDYLAQIAEQAKRMPDPDFLATPNVSCINPAGIEGESRIAANPQSCVINWDIHSVSTLSSEEILRQFDRYSEAIVREYAADGLNIEIKTATRYLAPPHTDDFISPWQQSVLDLCRESDPIASCEPTEASVYRDFGLPVVVCGPGSAYDAHGENEKLTQDQLARCETMLDRLLDRYLSENSNKTNPRAEERLQHRADATSTHAA